VALAEQLQGHVKEAFVSPHANHVLQPLSSRHSIKCLSVLRARWQCLKLKLDEIQANSLVEFPSSHPAILRKCIELIPPERLGFLLAEMHGHAVAAARHRYGDLVQWDCYGVVQLGVVDLGDSNE